MNNDKYIEIQNNSEIYIEKLKMNDQVSVKQMDLIPSINLIERKDPLWGYYPVKSFKINEKEISPQILFPNYSISCGDCFRGVCYLIKELKREL
jgi:hypothetical protein